MDIGFQPSLQEKNQRLAANPSELQAVCKLLEPPPPENIRASILAATQKHVGNKDERYRVIVMFKQKFTIGIIFGGQSSTL